MPNSKMILDAVDQLDQHHPHSVAPQAKNAQQGKTEHDDDFDAFKQVKESVAVVATTDKVDSAQKEASADEERPETSSNSSNKSTGDKEVDDIVSPSAANTAEDPTTGNRRYVSPKDFELLKVIGMGAFGKVLQVRNRQSKQVLAMKVISKRLLRRKGDGIIENILAERNILKRVRHPFVVAMHCSFQSQTKLFIIMDFLAGGELFLRLGREGIFLEKTAAFYLAEIILALDHLHSLGVLHRDLKPENILLSSDGHVCLTDFGLAKDVSGTGGFQNEGEDENKLVTICGTQEYMAPEMIARKGYGRAADFWSLGCIAYEMLKGLPPFESKEGAKVLFQKIMREKVKMPPGSSAAACKLLKGLLNRDVQSRLGSARSTMFAVGGVAGLKQAEFFAHIDWDKLERKEIDPPAVFAVESDGDVKYFHDEYTKMTLPRSVIEMSKEHFQPHRVESQAFRGFSFIQDDFLLPERDETELHKYWNSAEDDGESLSDTASSKLEVGGEAEVVPATPVTKKRPPRKRKKKNKDGTTPGSAATTPAGTAANTPVASAANTPEPSEAGDLPEKLEAMLLVDPSSSPLKHIAGASVPTPSETPLTRNTQQQTSTTQISKTTLHRAPQPVSLPMPSVTTSRVVAASPSLKPAQTATWQAASGKKKKNSAPKADAASKAVNQRRTPAPPGSNQWTATKQTPSQSISRTNQQRNGWNTASQQRQQQQQRSTPPETTTNSGWNNVSRAPLAGASQTPQSPSSDWRHHHMSPRDAQGRPVVRAPARQPSWPSLGVGGHPLGGASPSPSSKPKLHGAWAGRGK